MLRAEHWPAKLALSASEKSSRGIAVVLFGKQTGAVAEHKKAGVPLKISIAGSDKLSKERLRASGGLNLFTDCCANATHRSPIVARIALRNQSCSGKPRAPKSIWGDLLRRGKSGQRRASFIVARGQFSIVLRYYSR